MTRASHAMTYPAKLWILCSMYSSVIAVRVIEKKKNRIFFYEEEDSFNFSFLDKNLLVFY